MFTGIIERVGAVRSLEGDRLVVDPGSLDGDLALGESIAVNGVCLTLVSADRGLAFDVSPETFARTSLGDLKLGSLTNLERALRANARLGGHFVQGHVDATGEVVQVREEGEFFVYEFQAPPEYDRFLIDKGSVAVDGISLTVVRPERGKFEVWVIPHTREHTNLRERGPGDRVNLEFDMLAKYLEKLSGVRV